MTQKDYLFRGQLSELDPEVAELVRHETARQARTLIMIPSESTIPEAIREAVGSAFHNIYAEGYPLEKTRKMTQAEILDYETRLPEYRRNADERYYKGTEYANIIESLARRRTAEAFVQGNIKPEDLYVNVQPLSGAPANNAVYTALLVPGDTVMSMNLVVGGHLSHGAPVNRSGKFFNIVSYEVNPETEQLDYDRMMEIALEHKPKMIIGGYSSYPIAPDWQKYREVADAVGAYLLADVAHFAGMVSAGVYPNPVGIADIVTFTTHKTLGGPRGAVVMTHRKDLAPKLDRGVFPGEQGGPHMNIVAGLAVAMRFAQTDQFKQLQHDTATNARVLAETLQERGLGVPHGGTDSHMLVVDLKPLKGADGTSLSGDMAARILDLIGIVCNRQTIPGDTNALRPSGIRLGTPWITQRGFDEAMTRELGNIIADVLQACVPFAFMGRIRPEQRAKIDFDVFQEARLKVRDLIDRAGIDTDAKVDTYPHFSYIDDNYPEDGRALIIKGKKATEFLQVALTSDVKQLNADNTMQVTHILEPDGRVMASGTLTYEADDHYRLVIDGNIGRVMAWLRSLSDGFVIFDTQDVYGRVPGPVTVLDGGEAPMPKVNEDEGYDAKTYFIGQNGEHFKQDDVALETFAWQEAESELMTTPLTALHESMGAKMAPFAGYQMPLWYDKVLTEHLAVRDHAGIFDVSHMGVWEAVGKDAEDFLNAVTANDVQRLAVGKSHYTFLLDVDGIPHDDLLIYRLGQEHFFIVVNASNNDKNWAWLNAIKEGKVVIDSAHPQRQIHATDFVLRDLRAESSGADRRVDIAVQGPASRDILMALGGSDADLNSLKKLAWSGITQVTLGGYDLIVSRTGYTGERIAYEIFPHPDQAADLFAKIVALGATPCGLASRDSLRIEAGLPLYGHELAGDLSLNPADAGMGNYVKLYKPFFIGKRAFVEHEAKRDAVVTRFRMDNKGARPAHAGDPLVDKRGRVVGIVTSCSVDRDGYQLGQAYIKNEFAKRKTELAVFAGSQRAKAKSMTGLGLGDKVTMPEAVTVLRRFPLAKKK
jgi:glycine hydroxymethyltransferase